MFLQFACTHVRFLLYENYPNDKNIFNQVALLDIAIQGSIMNLDGNTGIDLTEESSEEEENVQPEKEVSCLSNVSNYHQNLFADIYAKLEEDKKQAVDREDFQAAAEIKACLKTFQDL